MPIKKSFRRAYGQAMVEFALVVPLLVLIVMGIFDLGRGIYAYNALASAAREGARYGTLSPSNTSSITAQVTSTTLLSPVNVVVNWSDSDASCTATTYTTSRKYICVTATHTFQPFTLFFSNLTLTGKSMMAIEP
jgi:Flp pilus assembly protein TadG